VSSIAPTSGIPASSSGHYAPGKDIPAIRNTRYLRAAAHLRRSMLPDEITDPDMATSRPPLPVGRAYAIQVLFRHGSRIPMLAVDVGKVRKSCWVALVQTTVRDIAAIGALAAGLIIEPWGMIITLGIVAAAVMLTRRSRFFLALIFLGVVCVALALVNGNRTEQISLGTPLACLALGLLVYLADVWLSMCYVRSIWRRSARQEKALAALRSSPVEGAPPADKARLANRRLIPRMPARLEHGLWPYAGRLGDGRNSANRGTRNGNASNGNGNASNGNVSPDRDLDSSGGERAMPAMTGPIRVYYAQNEFIGAGTSLRPLTLTALLSKPPDASRDVDAFNVSELMTKLRDHLISQAAGDAEVDGWAYQPLPPNGADLSPHEPGHFTYGLPHLDVTEVEATPAPDKDRWLGTPITVRRFDFHSPPDHDMPGLANRSPSVHPERHYVRIMTTSWHGQLTATVFVNAILQGHFLRVIMRPYVLAPAVKDLGVAYELTQWNRFFLIYYAVRVTARQFRAVAAKFKRPDGKPDKTSRPKPRRADLYSIREFYARPPYASDMQQVEDSDRAIAVIEEKIFRVTVDFLKEHNVDVTEFEKQMQSIIYNNTVNGNIASGTFNNSPMTSVSGQGNTANSTKTTTTNGKA
jgi:hypothetical protein